MSKRISYELYNPSLSLEDNAVVMGCSVATVKKFILKHDIDRQYDSSYLRWKKINDFKATHPDCSLKRKSEKLGYSINTIRKYEGMSENDLDMSIMDTNKVSTFNIKNRNCIKTVSNSQDEILFGIMRLHNGNKPFECDLTYSKGLFYKKVPEPALKFDMFPQLSDVRNLEEVDSLPDSSVSSIVFDLPFILSDNSQSIIKERFTYFTSIDELYEANNQMLERSYRLLKNGGLLVVKTMDIGKAGKQYWVSDYVLSRAEKMGFELIEKFILVARMRLLRKTRQQHWARKWHSYFFVFRKRGHYSSIR